MAPTPDQRLVTTSTSSSSSRPTAVTKASASASGKKSLSGTYYLDPCLRNPLFSVPHGLRTTTDGLLTGLSAYPDEGFNWTTGAPISGVAKLAKSYILPPDATFESEKGGLSLKIGVVDESGGKAGGMADREEAEEEARTGKKKEKKRRTRARVAVSSDRGGVDLDIVSNCLDARWWRRLALPTPRRIRNNTFPPLERWFA